MMSFPKGQTPSLNPESDVVNPRPSCFTRQQAPSMSDILSEGSIPSTNIELQPQISRNSSSRHISRIENVINHPICDDHGSLIDPNEHAML